MPRTGGQLWPLRQFRLCFHSLYFACRFNAFRFLTYPSRLTTWPWFGDRKFSTHQPQGNLFIAAELFVSDAIPETVLPSCFRALRLAVRKRLNEMVRRLHFTRKIKWRVSSQAQGGEGAD